MAPLDLGLPQPWAKATRVPTVSILRKLKLPIRIQPGISGIHAEHDPIKIRDRANAAIVNYMETRGTKVDYEAIYPHVGAGEKEQSEAHSKAVAARQELHDVRDQLWRFTNHHPDSKWNSVLTPLYDKVRDVLYDFDEPYLTPG